MFDSLSDRLQGIVKRLRGKGRLTEDEVDEVLNEIRTALLEADVNISVVRVVVGRIREQAIGAEVSQALDPGQQIVKIVHQELIALLGGETLKITYNGTPPTVVLMAGLQGSGKTTSAAKLARWFKSQGRQPLLVGADLQRPAAVEQLRTLGSQIGVPVFSDRPCGSVLGQRVLAIDAPASGAVPSTVPPKPRASTRPRPQPSGRSGTGLAAETRCSTLQRQLDELDDRMRAGYSSREAARLWNRWRELKDRLRTERC
jgi:hypothetical protein